MNKKKCDYCDCNAFTNINILCGGAEALLSSLQSLLPGLKHMGGGG